MWEGEEDRRTWDSGRYFIYMVSFTTHETTEGRGN